MANRIQILGTKSGKLTVIEELNEKTEYGNYLCLCKCECGKIVKHESSRIKKGRINSCGCDWKQKAKDLVGKKFNKVTVLSNTNTNDKKGSILWNCLCDCGKECILDTLTLIKRKNTSCGCTSKRNRDLTGLKVGKLTVIKLSEEKRSGKRSWECLCECGKMNVVNQGNLIGNKTKSCGCQLAQVKYKDKMVGETFGRLLVIKEIPTESGIKNLWDCLCLCGNNVILETTYLVTGKTKSCGCLSSEIASIRGKTLTREKNNRWRGGIAIDYDDRKTKEYNDWRKAILKKYKRTCVVCQGQSKIQAHHLYSYVDNPAIRFDLENGVAICKTCHDQFHMEYGYGNNTPEQFYAFQSGVWGSKPQCV